MKKRLRSILGSKPGRAALRTLELLDLDRPHFLRVLTYHTIEDPAGFRAQMEFLALRAHCVRVSEILSALEEEQALPSRAILITFDDADRDFGEIAWPILRELGLPAVLFVPTAYPDHPERVFWWDRLGHALQSTQERTLPIGPESFAIDSPTSRANALRALKLRAHAIHPRELDDWAMEIAAGLGVCESRSRTMSWQAIATSASEGAEIGGHTHTHPFLDRLDPAALQAELETSSAILQQKLGVTPASFAYPNGRYSPAVVEALRSVGTRLAFTTERGANDLRSGDPLRLRRINIGPLADRETLRARLLESSPRRRSTTRTPPATGGPRAPRVPTGE